MYISGTVRVVTSHWGGGMAVIVDRNGDLWLVDSYSRGWFGEVNAQIVFVDGQVSNDLPNLNQLVMFLPGTEPSTIQVWAPQAEFLPLASELAQRKKQRTRNPQLEIWKPADDGSEFLTRVFVGFRQTFIERYSAHDYRDKFQGSEYLFKLQTPEGTFVPCSDPRLRR